MPLSTSDLGELRKARALLEGHGLLGRMAEALGRPIEGGLERLPGPARRAVHAVARRAIARALRAALGTLGEDPGRASSERLHKALAAASGAAGGLFGLGGLAVELPLTTVVMLRSIADVARSEGHELSHPETRLACLEVFALGGGPERAAGEAAYYAVRASLTRAVSEAARHVAERGLSSEGAPVLVRLLAMVTARFGIVVEQKVALASVPLVGAATAALVNTAFLDLFQRRARGHFVVRRLEAVHGFAAVREAWRAFDGTTGFQPA